MDQLIKKHADKIRFILVGGTNTIIDISILFLLVNFSPIPIIFCNIISTSIALIFSFFANKTFTFKDKDGITKTKTTIFLIITLTGLWIIQPIIIAIIKSIFGQIIMDNNLILLIGKIFATCVTLVWNYVLYRKFVFKNPNISQELI